MPNNANPDSLHVNPGPGLWRELRWRYALGTFTTALFLLGAATLFRLLLPGRPSWANLSALAATFLWRLGVHKIGVFPWTFRSGEDRTSFSLPQALIDGFAFFVFMLVVLIFQSLKVSSSDLALAAIGGLVGGAYSAS